MFGTGVTGAGKTRIEFQHIGTATQAQRRPANPEHPSSERVLDTA